MFWTYLKMLELCGKHALIYLNGLVSAGACPMKPNESRNIVEHFECPASLKYGQHIKGKVAPL